MNELLKGIHLELGIDATHLATNKLAVCEQPALSELEVAEIDIEGRPFILEKRTAKAWREMRAGAAGDGVEFGPFSGFRSYGYQAQLIKGGLGRGKTLEAVLTSLAIPGFSQHHSGRAIDIWSDGKFELTEAFEKTAAFTWLEKNAARFGFSLTYPRDNDVGIIYEPWHWYFEHLGS